MGPNESALEAILNEPEWDAPTLLPLEDALGPLNRVLSDLSQPDSTKWSGAAAQEAANAFANLHASYRKLELAVSAVRKVVDSANAARNEARTAFHGLPEPIVPGWVHDKVAQARVAGESNVVIGGAAYVAERFVSIFEGWLGEDREEEAHEVLETLRGTLILANQALRMHKKAIQEAAGYEFPDPVPDPDPTSSEWEIPGPPDQKIPRPVVPLPGIKPGKPPEYGISPPTPGAGPWPVNPGPGPGVPTPIQPPGEGTQPWPPRTGGPTPSPYPYPGDGGGAGGGGTGGGGTGGDGDYPYGRRPDVDSGSAGSIGNPGLTAGLLGGGALAGGAALRWGSRGSGAGLQGLGPGGAGGPGGVGGSGGLLGSGGTGAGGAGGLAGGRGLAGGLPGSGSGAAGSSGAASAGMGAKAGGTPGGGMMAGGGQGGTSGKKDKKSGLGGHIAPKLEDDDDFIPQSDSARAGSREDFQ